MEGIDYLEDALKAMNTGAANLNSKTLAQINAMNIELKNADGSLAGKYKLSEFLENVIYSYLSTTKASSLASVLGEAPRADGSCDDLKNGLYFGSDLTNCPRAGITFLYITYTYGTYKIQFACRPYQGDIYTRTCTQGTWGVWYKFTTT